MSSVWEVLSAIDCSAHIEKKGKFSYLAWTWAIAMVKERYPDAKFEMEDDVVYPDGTMEVRATITIDGQSHTQWLPVLDYSNNAISNPDAFAINTARMRALVKGIAVGFGLGHYIFAGESFPQAPSFTQDQKDRYVALMAGSDGWGLKQFANDVGSDVMDALFNDAPKGQKSKQKDMCRKLVVEANTALKLYLAAIEEAIEADSPSTVAEIFDELTVLERSFVDAGLSEVQFTQIADMAQEF